MSHSPPSSSTLPPQPDWVREMLLDPMALEAVWGKSSCTQKYHWSVLCKCHARLLQMKGFCSWEKHIKTDQHKGLKAQCLRFRAHPSSQAALHQLEAPGPDTIRPTFQSLSANEVPILGLVSIDQNTKDLPGFTIFSTGASNDDDDGTMSLPVPVNSTPASDSGSEVAPPENSMLVFGSAAGVESLANDRLPTQSPGAVTLFQASRPGRTPSPLDSDDNLMQQISFPENEADDLQGHTDYGPEPNFNPPSLYASPASDSGSSTGTFGPDMWPRDPMLPPPGSGFSGVGRTHFGIYGNACVNPTVPNDGRDDNASAPGVSAWEGMLFAASPSNVDPVDQIFTSAAQLPSIPAFALDSATPVLATDLSLTPGVLTEEVKSADHDHGHSGDPYPVGDHRYNGYPYAGEWSITALQAAAEPSSAGEADTDMTDSRCPAESTQFSQRQASLALAHRSIDNVDGDYDRVYSPQTQSSLDPALKYSDSEVRIAQMSSLFMQLDPSGTSIHSISDTFVVSSGGGTVLLDVFIVLGAVGFCFSETPAGLKISMDLNLDTFRHQGLLPKFSHLPLIRDAAYAHSRLAPSAPDNNSSSLRVVRFSGPSPTGIRFLQSGTTTFTLADHHAYECTFDDLQLRHLFNNQVVRDHFEQSRTAMEHTCVEWLVALLGILALAPTYEKLEIVSIHQQYLYAISELEELQALEAGYSHSPWTFLPYARATAEFASVTNLLTESIVVQNLGGQQLPSPMQIHLVKTLGRLMAEGSAAPYFFEPRPAQIRSRWYYFEAAAKLRQDFMARVQPALVPNYLPREVGHAVRSRRLELENCEGGKQPNPFVLPIHMTPRTFPGDPLALKPVDMSKFRDNFC